jgi:guanine deaminase
MHETHAAAAVCPTSNLFLGSGFFDHESADRFGVRYGLGSDVGGGTSFSPFRTMLATYFVGRECRDKKGVSIAPSALWWSHTGGAARALGLGGVIGTLQAGTEADFVVLNPKATPLLARKVERAQNLEEMLFAIIVLGDDRVIERVVIA